MPPRPGRWRDGLGFAAEHLVITKKRKATKRAEGNRAGTWEARNDPQNVPIRMPGVMFRTASHWTPLLRLWASELEIDVNMMLPIEVPGP